MSIQEIEKRIVQEAEAEAAKIKKEAEEKLRQLEKVHAHKKEEVRARLMREAQHKAEELKKSYLVPARLKARKALLEEKQKILGRIYHEIKREKKLSAAEISKIREESEVKAAHILFGKQK
jgi:V/A-type H+-transporting ATPase subunit E